MSRKLMNRIGTVFIPVSNIEKAKSWYCKLLDLPETGEILHGHLYVLPLEGDTGLVLDSKIYDPESRRNTPLFHFNCDNIELVYQSLQEKGVEVLTGIENGHWFNFTDPDGNVLMVCRC
ncbi:VOC family protein [Brevibacillus panacihumi]|uniref:VOC family protein n=1 Tax=Brevibacillus panacihumi TaxID=497735 RepID=A0A3M8CCZ2_9BACL|nr:VOC family protein [Brevibacillus panacihumi]RNB73277.1 VOC family protein [Brevibacillus panacihumi]